MKLRLSIEVVQVLSKVVLQFVDEFVGSIAQLETLLLLSTNPNKWFCADDVARAVFINTEHAKQALFPLFRAGLLQRNIEQKEEYYQFHPRDLQLIRDVNELAAAYKEDRGALVSRVFARPARKSFFSDLSEENWQTGERKIPSRFLELSNDD